jgi:hypothetical protein
MRAWILLLLLSACSSVPCKTVVKINSQPQIVNHYIVIHDRPVHAALLRDYELTVKAERTFVSKSKAPAIERMMLLGDRARTAIGPIQRPGHRATAAEIQQAIDALAAIQAYMLQNH